MLGLGYIVLGIRGSEIMMQAAERVMQVRFAIFQSSVLQTDPELLHEKMQPLSVKFPKSRLIIR
jgi:hypothetical protein